MTAVSEPSRVPGAIRSQLIDIDVHERAALEELVPYLAPQWRRYITDFDNRRVDYMRGLYSKICHQPDDVEARCLLSMTLFVGSYFVAADHGRSSRTEVIDNALEHLLAPPVPT